MTKGIPADGAACACFSGHRCCPCKRRGTLRVRLITTAWRDDPTKLGTKHARVDLTHEQQIDKRDRAWTARDLYSIYVDRERYAHTWWELHWPEYWQRQSDVRDHHPRPSAEDIAGWAEENDRDITIGEKISDGFPEDPDTRACAAPLDQCDEPAFVFARSLVLDPDDLTEPLTHHHRYVPSMGSADTMEGDLDLFTATGVAA